MNKFFLWLVLLPSALWRQSGADTDQLRAILEVKLMLDDRKPMGMGRPTKAKKDRKYGSVLQSVMFLVMGSIYIMPILTLPDLIFGITIYFTCLLGVLTLMLITDFSNVLFDSRDKYIIFPRPVGDKTIVLARLLHVFIYLTRIVLPLSIPGWIVLGYRAGWPSVILFPLPILLLISIALFTVNGIYLLVLQLAKAEKFRDVINYFQVVVSVVFFASVYLFPRLFDSERPFEYKLADYPWVQLLPPYWLATCWSWIGIPLSITGSAWYSLLAIALPVGCMYALVKWLAPSFAQKISSIDTVSEGNTATIKGRKASKSSFYLIMATFFNRTEEGKAGFILAWLQTSRSRSFRMRVYPTFAYVPVYFVYMLLQNDSGTELQHTSKFLLLLYMSSFAMVSALSYLVMSDQYKAAWVYYALPVPTPGHIMAGAFKAIWVKYFLPFYIVLAGYTMYIWGTTVVWDIVLAFVNVSVFVSCIARASYLHLPFSIMEQTKQGGRRIFKSMIFMAIPAVLGLGHYLALHLLWLKLIFLLLSVLLLWLVIDSYGRTTWSKIIKNETEQ